MLDDRLYSFPPPPALDSREWPGSPLGVSNIITRTRSRTAVHDKRVDATPGLLARLLQSAHDHLNRIEGKQAIYTHDVVIHGIRVRATTNSPHLYDFWVDNWYSLEEWQQLTGQAPPAEPRVQVYALHGLTNEQEAAYYSHDTNTIVFFNTAYYGQLKSWVLGAVGRILAAECGIHSIHGACVEKDGDGVLYIAPTGTGKSTSSYGLMAYPRTRFHSDDWVYVRYAYETRDGRRVSVLSATGSNGSKARGYQVYRWMEQHARDKAARLSAMTLENQPLRLTLGELDLAQPIEAYAYTSEKVFYLRTNLAENFPLSACQILASKQENVPDISSRFLLQHDATLASMMRDLKESDHCVSREALRGRSDVDLEQICGRLIAFENARSMLDISNVLSPERVYTNPMEPVRLGAVMLLKRNADHPTVLAHLSLDQFMERLLVGETPEKKYETAYNAYRAVDDQAERTFIEALKKQTSPSRTLYSLFSQAGDVPASLAEEFELFRVMYQTAHCYDLNTILQQDERVSNKREAVGRTMDLIAQTLEEEPQGIHLSIENYAAYID